MADSKPVFPFMDLPGETRNQIYECFITAVSPSEYWWNILVNDQILAINRISVNRQVRQEITSLYYDVILPKRYKRRILRMNLKGFEHLLDRLPVSCLGEFEGYVHLPEQ